jgi:hypothetical protein
MNSKIFIGSLIILGGIILGGCADTSTPTATLPPGNASQDKPLTQQSTATTPVVQVTQAPVTSDSLNADFKDIESQNVDTTFPAFTQADLEK